MMTGIVCTVSSKKLYFVNQILAIWGLMGTGGQNMSSKVPSRVCTVAQYAVLEAMTRVYTLWFKKTRQLWGNHAKCCMDGKKIRCLQIVLQHVLIYLQQFPSYSNRKCKKSPFSRTAVHIFVFPGDAPATITQYVAWIKRQFNACQILRWHVPIYLQ